MEYYKFNVNFKLISSLSIALAHTLSSNSVFADEKVIEITQVPCQFLESEEKDYKAKSSGKRDCSDFNRSTFRQREAEFKELRLKAGKYVFRVTNMNVPYTVGFWIRGAGIGRVTLPSVSGGGLTPGKTKDYEITLVPGKYLYSCPLNPTLDYPLTVIE